MTNEENKKLIITTFKNVSLAAFYIFAVSQIMKNGEKLFGNDDNILMPFVFLLLFSLSAAVVGGLMLGSSIFLFLEGKRKESVKSIIYSICWLGFYTLIFLTLLFFLSR